MKGHNKLFLSRRLILFSTKELGIYVCARVGGGGGGEGGSWGVGGGDRWIRTSAADPDGS